MNVHATHHAPTPQVQHSSHQSKHQANDGPKVNNDHPKTDKAGKTDKIVDKTA